MSQLDDTDRRLLAELGTDARLPVATLARRLGLARSTVQARLERLERGGVIAGYALVLGDGANTDRIGATVLLQIDPRAAPAILARLRASPAIQRATNCSGRFDLILEVTAPTPAKLDALLDDIGAVPGVKSSESLVHLATKIDRTAIR